MTHNAPTSQADNGGSREQPERCHCERGCLWAATQEDLLCDKCRLAGHVAGPEPKTPKP